MFLELEKMPMASQPGISRHADPRNLASVDHSHFSKYGGRSPGRLLRGLQMHGRFHRMAEIMARVHRASYILTHPLTDPQMP